MVPAHQMETATILLVESIRSNEPVAMMVVEAVVAFVPMQQAVIAAATSIKSVVGEATGATTQPVAT